MSTGLRSIPRRLLPETAWRYAQFLRLRARHLPMRFSAEGRAARTRLGAYRDAHRGETCFILGNGPSLRDVDPASLDGTPTFCLNRGYLFWENTGRRPTYYVAVNPLVIDQFHDEIAELPCPLFLPWIYRDRFAGVPNATFFEVRIDDKFITDPLRGIAPGATVTIAALQLAYHMGFEEVVLLGVDHRFEMQGPPHAEVRQAGDDPNHFRPDYFGTGVLWNYPDLVHSERGYATARAAFEADGRRIINATPDSELDVFTEHSLVPALQGAGREQPATAVEAEKELRP